MYKIGQNATPTTFGMAHARNKKKQFRQLKTTGLAATKEQNYLFS
jgi:hypothetical protein